MSLHDVAGDFDNSLDNEAEVLGAYMVLGNTSSSVGRASGEADALRARVADLETLAKRWEQSSAELIAKLDRERELSIPSVAAERDRRAEYETRRTADRDASWAHHADPGFEHGDIWATPSDES